MAGIKKKEIGGIGNIKDQLSTTTKEKKTYDIVRQEPTQIKHLEHKYCTMQKRLARDKHSSITKHS
jgi:hypothetical protein